MARTSPQKKAKQLAKLLRNVLTFGTLRPCFDTCVLSSTCQWMLGQRSCRRFRPKMNPNGTMRRFGLSGIDVDFRRCQIDSGKGDKDRIVPFPDGFKELLAIHVKAMKKKGARHLFESSWKKRYTDRGIRKILEKYSKAAALTKTISQHKGNEMAPAQRL